MVRPNIIKDKTFAFAIEIILFARELQYKEKEFILSRQLYKSGTAIGASVREAEYAESISDFIHKFSVSLKEANETIYWLELVVKVFPHKGDRATILLNENNEIRKILSSIIKSCKSKKK